MGESGGLSQNSELVGILGHREARYGLASAFPFYFNPKDGGGFPAGRTKHGEGSQSFTIEAGNQKSPRCPTFSTPDRLGPWKQTFWARFE